MMKSAPVSAVMPAYNAEAFIRAAIESVLGQTLPVAEFFVVDDGSTDQTAQIAASMGARVISHGHTNISGVRNLCVRESSQPWLAFIDADDIWEPDKIQKQMELISHHPDVGLITSDYLTFDREGTIVRSGLEYYCRDYQAQPKGLFAGGALIDELAEAFSSIGYFLVPSAVIVRRDLLAAVGAFDEDLDSAEDFDCFMRVLSRTRLAIVEKVLIRRREHDQSLSSARAKVTHSCLAATHKVLGQPNLYPPAAVAICRNSLPAHLRHAAAHQLWAGDARGARELLLKSARLELNPRTILALLASLTPARVARDVMRARYYVSRTLGI